MVSRRNRYLILALSVIISLALVTIFYWLRRTPPSNHLRYFSNGFPHLLDLETGEDAKIENGTPRDIHTQHYPSPDGQWIAHWSIVKEWYWWKLELENISSGEVKKIGEFSACDGTLSWSPDSGSFVIAYIADPDDTPGIDDTMRCEIFRYNLAAGDFTRLTTDNYSQVDPAFSPDGSKLVYSSSEDGYYRLYIMDLDTRDHKLLTPNSFGFRPAWSPDGQWIAFMSNHERWNDDIYRIAPDGTGFQRLTTGDQPDDNPEWLP